MNEKVYEVVVRLHVYGQKSKAAAEDFLMEALAVDGLAIEGKVEPKLLKKDEQ